jgi:hypothetical protein
MALEKSLAESDKIYTYELQLPVTGITLKGGLALSERPPDSLLVSVTATGKRLLRRQWREAGVRINATQYPTGHHSLTLSKANTFLMHTSDFITLDEVLSPTAIPLEIDAESSRRVEVKANLDLTPDEGFAIGQQLLIEPPAVTLEGPKSKLGDVSTVVTEARRLGGLRNEITLDLALILPTQYGFRLRPDTVRVTIPVVPVKTRVYEHMPVAVFNAPLQGAAVTVPAEVRAEITGPPEDIDLLNRNAVTLSVDYRYRSGSGRAAVKVDLPPGFTLKRLSDDSVQIVVNPDADTRH